MDNIFHTSLENASEPVYIHGKGKFTYLNPAACRLFGVKIPEELVGRSVLERVHPDFHIMVKDPEGSMQTIAKEFLQYKIIRMDGSEVWVETAGKPVSSERENSCLVILRDITNQKKTDKTLRNSNETMIFALETSRIGIWELDLEKFTVSRSLTYDNIFGYSELLPEWTYDIFLRHVHTDDRNYVNEKFKIAVETAQDWRCECRIFRRDGQLRWISAAGRTLTGTTGENPRMIGIVQDITGRKLDETRLNNSYSMLRMAGEIARFGAWSVEVNNTTGQESNYELDNQVVNWTDIIADIHGAPLNYIPTVKEAIGFYAPEWRERITRIFTECAEKGKPFDEEMEIITTRGEPVWIRTTGKAIWENGKIVRVQGALQDISRIRTAEQKSREMEEKYRESFQKHVAVKLIIDSHTGDIVEVNDAATRFYGWTAAEMKKMNISQINTLSPEKIKKEMARARKDVNVYYNFRHRTASGKIKDVEVYSSKITTGGKEHFHCIVHNVTQRKRAEKQLNLLSRAIEQSTVSVVITDASGKVEYVNPQFKKTTGYTYKEIRGKTLSFLKSGHHPREFYADLWETILSDKDWNGEIQNKKKNGELYWIQADISPVCNDLGEITNFVAISEDITQRKKMVEELEAAKERAEENDRLKSAFLANMSHEIRTPMNGILGFAEILKEPRLTGREHKAFIEIIEKSGKRMLDTLNALIDISQIETGQIKTYITETNVNTQLSDIFRFFKPQAEEKGLQLALKDMLPETLATIDTDRAKLDSILTNLVTNAIKFTDKGIIEMGCRQKGYFLEFYVKDTGTGVPPGRHEAIFNRFEQAQPEHKNAYQGAGLGLAISRSYVKMLGGEIWLESREGQGTTFFFTIPFKVAEFPAGRQSKGKDSKKGYIPQLEGKTILLAEDDPYSREMMVYQLKKTGAALVAASGGLEAWNMFLQENVDLVLLDIRMPEMDGYQVLNQIRSRNTLVPVIAQTAYATLEDIKTIEAAGFTDYLTKPISNEKLYNLLHKYLNANNRLSEFIP